MGNSLTTDKMSWTQQFTGLKIPESPPAGDGEANQNGAMPGEIQDLRSGLGATVQFKHPPDPDKLKADVKTIEDAQKDWQAREDKLTVTYEMSAVIDPYVKARTDFDTILDAGSKKHDLSDAVKGIASVEKTLKALEAASAKIAKDLPKKQKAATDAGDKVDKMSDDDVKKMKASDKAALVKQMLGAGQPSGKVRDAQKKLYNDTEIDPDYRKDDKARQDKVAADLKGDKELGAARGKWDKLNKDELRKMLNKVLVAQSKEYGITPPPIVFWPDEEPGISKSAGVVAGFFSPADGKLHMNLDPASGIKDFTETIDTVLHENAHHYQNELVKLLKNNKLKPGDPRYNQALMFEVNGLNPGGYIDPDEGKSDYEQQPLERSSFETGTDTAGKVAAGVTAIPPGH